MPLIIAHRGASAFRPEHTLEPEFDVRQNRKFLKKEIAS